MKRLMHKFSFAMLAAIMVAVAGCSSSLPPADQSETALTQAESGEYVIGPRDSLDIFVWRSPELSKLVPVRPDGRVSIPLVDDMQAAGKTPSMLARDIEAELEKFVTNPVVTVIVQNFVGPYGRQVRVIGEASQPAGIAYNEGMTLLDVMIAVGGITEFADGNGAILQRGDQQFQVRLDDLLLDGDVSANVAIWPGDVIMIPEDWF
ncbi:XrtA/PEP-CTERM system exopolysaccharide export protein [Aestuariispira insulae]|uniref:Polysaccharide export outer membrane protein n=1 Tax=Aestuariispira insulae TaxID=1461337 RepID=A0A3D9HK40_9PROT|nr:XrtA/PEP-CTERM system exopolysaccharide export protein [Aestuariispira insulae]RED49860.1 polysaccharide export outer membrane protein [Aestuariispira insulae]